MNDTFELKGNLKTKSNLTKEELEMLKSFMDYGDEYN